MLPISPLKASLKPSESDQVMGSCHDDRMAWGHDDRRSEVMMTGRPEVMMTARPDDRGPEF